MNMRNSEPIVTGEIYHIYTKSIAGFKVFNCKDDFDRIKMLLSYYMDTKPSASFSIFYRKMKRQKKDPATEEASAFLPSDNKLVNILSYCIMPTHIHLILQQQQDKGISTFMNIILNGYTRYFNSKYKRKGPLWETRFNRVRISSDEQLYHLTRYIHLNPVTDYLVDKPEKWNGSSYKEFIGKETDRRLCKFDNIMIFNPDDYIKFVNENIGNQRELAVIKRDIKKNSY